MTNEPTRVYTDKPRGFAVEWRDYLCIHCENCVNGLPTVFDMAARPWVNIDGATEKEIEQQCAQCPDEALKFVRLQ